MPDIYGKNAKKLGLTPAVALINPKFPHNVGAALRAASCFGAHQVWFTGDRVTLGLKGAKRLPREERMKGYRDVELRHYDNIFDQYGEYNSGSHRTSAEFRNTTFVHPEKALYIWPRGWVYPSSGSSKLPSVCRDPNPSLCQSSGGSLSGPVRSTGEGIPWFDNFRLPEREKIRFSREH